MRTWDDYKKHVKAVSHKSKTDMEAVENLAAIIGTIIEKRSDLGISQRELASMCSIPQSSVARIESFQTMPNVATLLKIMQPLGLKLCVSTNVKRTSLHKTAKVNRRRSAYEK